MPTIIPIITSHSCKTPEQIQQSNEIFIGFLITLSFILLLFHIYLYVKYLIEKKEEKKKWHYVNYNYLDFLIDDTIGTIIGLSTIVLIALSTIVFLLCASEFVYNFIFK
jgi:hypothetical protein